MNAEDYGTYICTAEYSDNEVSFAAFYLIQSSKLECSHIFVEISELHGTER